MNLAVGAALLAAGFLVYAFVTANLPGDVDPLRASAPATPTGSAVQVEIRNGCGAAGVARETTLFLRNRGYDVVEIGNYTDFEQAATRVIDRAGNREVALAMARALGVDETQVEVDVRPEALLDLTVVLGHDYPSLAPFIDQ